MLLDTATEKIGHVEMLATMVARLLETSPVEAEKAAENGSDRGVLGTVLGGDDTQHAVVSGGGSTPRDSLGNPWNAAYTIASGNLLADMRFNVTAVSQGRLQVARLYQLTEDAGVRDVFSFLLARDTMHRNQWLAAIEELNADGLEDTPVPSNFPRSGRCRAWPTSSRTSRRAPRARRGAGERTFYGRQGGVRVRSRARGPGPRDGRNRTSGRAKPVLDPQAAHVSGLFVRRPMEGRGTYHGPSTWSRTSENAVRAKRPSSEKIYPRHGVDKGCAPKALRSTM